MGRGSRVVAHRRLTGGVCSAVHRLTVERRGVRTFVVLRQYPAGVGVEADLEREIANLGVVAGSALPVPSMLATDVSGEWTGGAPSLLMTRLPGHVHLTPVEPRSWTRDRGPCCTTALPRPSGDDVQTLGGFVGRSGKVSVPVAAQKPAVWKAAFGVMAAAPPEDLRSFSTATSCPSTCCGRGGGLPD